MSAASKAGTPIPPRVSFISRRPGMFTMIGSEWHHLTIEDEAHSQTGMSHETKEPSVGVFIGRRQNGLLKLGFDLARIGVNLRQEVVKQMEQRWRDQAAKFSKPLFRSVQRRAHFSRSFAQFEIAPERVEQWRGELSAILENPASYEPIPCQDTEF